MGSRAIQQRSPQASSDHHLVKPSDFGKVLQISATVSAKSITMKTQGEIEAAICEGINRFEQEYRGRGPKEIHAYLLGDFVVIRLQGLLTTAEQHFAKIPSDKGRNLLKQIRTHVIETANPLMRGIIQKITGVTVVSLHHDISTVTGEGFMIFTLAAAPIYRKAKK